MPSKVQQNSIEISRKILYWLVSKATEIEFSDLLNIFLLGETVQQSIGYVLSYKSSVDPSIIIKGKSFIRRKRNVIEILPSPDEKQMVAALKELENLEISETNMPTKDLYLETPRSSNKDFMMFVLGE